MKINGITLTTPDKTPNSRVKPNPVYSSYTTYPRYSLLQRWIVLPPKSSLPVRRVMTADGGVKR